MTFNRFFILLLLLCSTNTSLSQIEVNNRVVFNSTNNNERQLLNVNPITDSSSIINRGELTNGTGRYYKVVNQNDTLYPIRNDSMTLSGTAFFLKVDQKNESSIAKLFWNESYYPIFKNSGSPINAYEWDDNAVLLILIDSDTAFLYNQQQKTCPSGFIKVNEKYCIEVDERSPKNYYDAVIDCADNNTRLCNWSEYYYACQKLGSTSMLNAENNYEWVDDAANSPQSIRIVGNGSCAARGTHDGATLTNNYRCCVSLY